MFIVSLKYIILLDFPKNIYSCHNFEKESIIKMCYFGFLIINLDNVLISIICNTQLKLESINQQIKS